MLNIKLFLFLAMLLFEPYKLGSIILKNRMVMAPLTRRRAIDHNIPNSLMAEYYGQRASAGLIIAEGTSPSPNGLGYIHIPGLYNKDQMEGWKLSTSAVHKKGGKIFLQIMHTGRIGHPNNLPEGGRVIGPSAVAQQGEVSTYDMGKQPYPVPEEMSIADIKNTIEEFKQCAILAIEAGFDGVEIHSAHGYLPNQFLNTSSNQRSDEYGGSTENRMRFLFEVIEHTVKAIGSEKVGLRISPYSYADKDEDPKELNERYLLLSERLNKYDLAYLHLSHMGDAVPEKFQLWKEIRKVYKGSLILCGDLTKESGEEKLENNEADLIAFGRDFIANPDLVERFKNDWPLSERDRSNWYTHGSEGYTDYMNYQGN